MLENAIPWFRTFAGEALKVEVLILHPQHLALTWLPTLVALDQGLICGVMLCVLRMGHCKRGDTGVITELTVETK